MKRIGFDIDGTISMNDNKYNLLRSLFSDFDENIHYTVYPLSESLINNGFVPDNFSNKEFYHANKEVMFGEGTFYDGFKKLHKFLLDNGFEIFYITARDSQYEPLTKKLFELNDIPYENVYHLGSYNKVGKILELNIDLFFEDNTSNINQIISETDILVGFIEAPYNKNFISDDSRVIMFREWENVLSYFKVI